jgi:hypothetical protein
MAFLALCETSATYPIMLILQISCHDDAWSKFVKGPIVLLWV